MHCGAMETAATRLRRARERTTDAVDGCDVLCIPRLDAAFAAAVPEATAALSADEADPTTAVEQILRTRYPQVSFIVRDSIAGFSTRPTSYAFRDGRRVQDDPRRILIIDDDPDLLDIIAEALEAGRFDIRSAGDGASALALIPTWALNLILLDLSMPLMSGDDFAARYRRLPPPRAPIIVVSGADDAALRAERMVARSVVGKPFDLASLTRMVDRYA